jgi:hypothetical protein
MIKILSAAWLTQPERIRAREKWISTVGGLWVYKVVNGKKLWITERNLKYLLAHILLDCVPGANLRWRAEDG